MATLSLTQVTTRDKVRSLITQILPQMPKKEESTKCSVVGRVTTNGKISIKTVIKAMKRLSDRRGTLLQQVLRARKVIDFKNKKVYHMSTLTIIITPLPMQSTKPLDRPTTMMIITYLKTQQELLTQLINQQTKETNPQKVTPWILLKNQKQFLSSNSKNSSKILMMTSVKPQILNKRKMQTRE